MFGETMEITAVVIQYILTVAQSFGSQDYNHKSLMMIHVVGLAALLFGENEQTEKKMNHRLFEIKYLLRCTGKLEVYLFLSVSFSQRLVFLGRL